MCAPTYNLSEYSSRAETFGLYGLSPNSLHGGHRVVVNLEVWPLGVVLLGSTLTHYSTEVYLEGIRTVASACALCHLL